MASLYSNVANFAVPVGKKKKAIIWITVFFFYSNSDFLFMYYLFTSYYPLCKSLEHYLFASITVSSSIYVRFMVQLEIFPCSARFALLAGIKIKMITGMFN